MPEHSLPLHLLPSIGACGLTLSRAGFCGTVPPRFRIQTSVQWETITRSHALKLRHPFNRREETIGIGLSRCASVL